MKKINFTKIVALCCGVFGLFLSQNLSAQCPTGQMEVTVTVTNEGFPGENGWILWDATAGAVAECLSTNPGVQNNVGVPACVTTGNTIELYTYESFGDGWNGGMITVETSEDGSLNGGDFNSFQVVIPPTGSTADDNDLTAGIGDGGIDCTVIGGGALTGPAFVVNPIPLLCDITCPPNQVASTAPGTCAGAFVPVPLPTVDADCSGVPANFVDATSGDVPLNFNFTGVITTNLTIPGVPTTLPAGITTVDLDFFWVADIGGAGFEQTALSLEGIPLGLTPNSAGDCNPAGGAETYTISAADYLAAAADGQLVVTIATDADIDNICANSFANASVSVPTAVSPYANDYNGGEDASDNYPLGVTTVVYTTQDLATGFPVSCSFTVTVEDQEAPVLTCPADQVINLDPGLCDAAVNYEVTFTENCPSDPFPVFANTDLELDGGYVACNPGALNSYYQILDLAALGLTTNADLVALQVGLNNGGPVTANLYEYSGPLAGPPALADLSLVATGSINGVGGQLNDIPVSGTITGGAAYVIEVVGQDFFLSFNDNGSTSLTYIAAAACGIVEPQTFASIGFAEMNGVMGIVAQTAIELVQTAGLASGESFPIGTTVNTFEVTDDSGNTGTCSFSVTVNEFANPVATLACNDNVQISLDEDGCSLVTADMVLEGGPYGCYDDYTLTRSGAYAGPCPAAPTSAVNAGCSDVGDTFTVTVTDPDTGNSCWSTVSVEDKLDPIIVCPDPVEVPACDGVADPNFGPAPAPITVTGVSADVGAPISVALPPATATAAVAGVPNNAIVTNVQVSIQATHTWVSDLTLELQGPNGVTIQLADGDCGANDNIDIIYDDAGALVTCSGGQPGMGGFVAPDDPLATFNGGNANGVWTLIVTDNFAGDDGTIDGFSVSVTAEFPNVPAATATDNCDVALTYIDNFFNLDCFDAAGNPDFAGRIERTWTATDASGNTATCIQVINLTRPTLANVVFPENITWQCEQFAAHPNIIDATALNPAIGDADPVAPGINVSPAMSAGNLASTGSGVPTINGVPVTTGDLCDIACDFEDDEIEICPGTTKILRQWTCIDWCAGESAEFDQIVKVVDETGPNLINPGDYNVDVLSASAPSSGVHTDCEGNPVIPAILDNGDNCSSIASYTTEIFSISGLDAQGNGIPDELLASSPSNGGFFQNLRLYDDNGNAARYVVCYSALDECDNETEVCVDVTLFDKIPPVAICDEITTISIGNQNADGNSCSSLAAAELDDGSYDNCTGVNFLVARMIGTNTDPTSAQYVYTPYEDFCCDDIPGPVMVFMLVLDDVAWNIYQNNYGQVQPDGQLGLRGNRLDLTNDDGTPLDLDGRWNFCMVEVLVEDKLPPVVTCPPNAKISCDEYAETLEAAFDACEGDDECESDVLTAAGYGTFSSYDNCEAIVTPTVSISINQCGVGSIVRTFSVVDPSGNVGAPCTQVISTYHVSDFVVEFPADIDGLCGDTDPSFGEPEIFFETCELVATSYEDQVFDVVPDACFKVVRQWTVINWCVVGDEIDEEIEEDPENALGLGFPACDLDGDGDCDDRTFRDSWAFQVYPGRLQSDFPAVACDNLFPDTDPDVDSWDGYITYQQTIKVEDLDAPVIDPTFALEGLCIITGNDGTDGDFSDCVYNGVLPTPEYTDCIIDVNGENEDGDLIDNAVIITTEVFDAAGNLVSTSVVLTDLPIGCYVARYTAVDRCGNTAIDEYEFCIDDCKLPTPYCKDGLVVELMAINDPNNTSFEPMVAVWAIDLDAGSFDNCPGGVQLSFSPNVNDVGVEFTCDNVGENTVELWVTDATGNQDFCETFIVVQANQGQCGSGDPLVAGNASTEDNDDIQDVTVSINNNTGFGATQTTGSNGNYDIAVPYGSDVTVTPSKDMNPRNGVTTFDLVTISKHILNINLLDSPYKMIAADANNSGSVTTLDLVQIRKLILFIDDEFSNNTSWRFVDADYNFPNASNPWAEAFPEVVNINNLTADQLNNNFVGVKIGDVNGSAAANELLGADDRSFNGALRLNTEDVAMSAGQVYNVEFTAADFNNFGYQFTMNFDANAVEFVGVGAGLATADNFGFSLLEEGVITASYNNAEAVRLSAEDAVFTLTFAAKADVQLSEVLSITSQYTAAEAYASNGDFQDVELTFNGTEIAGFELMQNTPNPFANETVIGFTLAQAKEATITISDLSGRVISVINVDAAKGYNQVTVSRDELSASGILYYQLDTDTDSATKKMILID